MNKTTKLNQMRIGSKFVDMLTGEELIILKKENNEITFSNGIKTTCLDTYRFVENKFPLNPQKNDFHLEDGHLSYKETQIVSGSLSIQSILGTWHNGVVISVLSKTDQSKSELYTYNALEDHFCSLKVFFNNSKLVYSDKKVMCLLIEEELKKEFYIENNEDLLEQTLSEVVYPPNKEVATVTESELSLCVLLDGTLKNITYITHDPSNKMFLNKRSDGDLTIVFTTNSNIKTIRDKRGDSVSICVPTNSSQIFQFNILPTVDQENELIDIKYSIQQFTTNSCVEKIQFLHDGNHSLFLLAEKEAIYTNANYKMRMIVGQEAVEAIKAHPFFIKLNPGEHRNEFIMANKEREIIKIIVTKTSDRGFVAKISK